MLKVIKTKLLSEQNVLPTKEVLQNVLGETYLVFNELMEIITNNQFRLVKKCGYYNEGKSWLCKVCYKKKTVFWLSVLDNFFKLGFYFNEKNGSGMANLEIGNNIKEDFNRLKKTGKCKLLVIDMHRKEQINDVIKLIEYKKGLK
jgi:hypothetical protein